MSTEPAISPDNSRPVTLAESEPDDKFLDRVAPQKSNWRHIHMALNIDGALQHGKLNYFTENGQPVRPAVARDILKLKLARGEKLMLMGDPKECPDFSPETGCPGHPCEAPAAA
jgi:hypothetical protein